MPVYDTTAAAEALGIPTKQLDNILSRHSLPGVEKRWRGVGRKIGPDAVVTLFLAIEFMRAARVPIVVALELAHAALTSGGKAELGQFAGITVDVALARASVAARLDAAVELVGRRPRGRRGTRPGG